MKCKATTCILKFVKFVLSFSFQLCLSVSWDILMQGIRADQSLVGAF